MSIALVERRRGESRSSLVLPGMLLAGLIALICLQTGLVRIPQGGVTLPGPQTVTIVGRSLSYRASGEYLQGTASIDAPLVHVERHVPIEIMKYQVSAAEFAQCVAEGACEKARPRWSVGGNVPATGVSYEEAVDYATWLGDRTGENWRLPTVEEWVFAAGSRAVDTAVGVAANEANPAERWLLAYRKEATLSLDGPAAPLPLGAFGTNEFGVADLSAVVWEWTSTCASRTTLSAAGSIAAYTQNCGARYLEGRHRVAMSTFIRDGVSGGCSIGVPPDNLGFRLVRDVNWAQRALAWIATVWPSKSAEL
jgi:formylglycine-generating enzyme required for sulfatase activity